MSEAELRSWAAFHRLYPLDDHNRLYKPAALVAAAMSGGFERNLEFLSPKHAASAVPLRPVQVIRPGSPE